jgi:hypothetical protein
MEVAPQRFVFPIFKNGSSSLRAQAKKDNWKILFNEQIYRCDKVEIFLREPTERLASGAGSFIDDMVVSGIDKDAVLEFIQRYPFLNRHYLPQIHWLVWLGRYLRDESILIFNGMDSLDRLVDYNIKGDRSVSPTKMPQLSTLPTLVFYMELDSYLYELRDSEMTLKDLLISMRNEHKQAYEHVFGHAKRLADVLP